MIMSEIMMPCSSMKKNKKNGSGSNMTISLALNNLVVIKIVCLVYHNNGNDYIQRSSAFICGSPCTTSPRTYIRPPFQRTCTVVIPPMSSLSPLYLFSGGGDDGGSGGIDGATAERKRRRRQNQRHGGEFPRKYSGVWRIIL